MENSYTLSYIIATRNQLPFLQITLRHLLDEVKSNEEIVVVDGDSADGSKEYLQQLFNEGKIHQFISEPDHNQAHAWNKAMLLAKGQIIKKIIDDDVFDYQAIRTCCNFMLKNPQIDVCISNSLNSAIDHHQIIWADSRLPYFLKWKADKKHVFQFSDVHMLIRKTSLSFIGLYDTQFTMMDWEYSLRITYLKCGISYFTGYNAMSVGRSGNITSTTSKEILQAEGLIGKTKYQYDDGISLYSKFKIRIGLFLHSLKKQEICQITSVNLELDTIYTGYYQKLKEYNQKIQPEFIL